MRKPIAAQALALVALPFAASAGCSSPARDPLAPTLAASASAREPSASSTAVAADASAPLGERSEVVKIETPEPPLRWGTRPPKEGLLFPALDGMCIHMETWPLDNGAMLVYGNSVGAWTRGSEPTFGFITSEGIERVALPMEKFEGGSEPEAFAGGFKGIVGEWPNRLLVVGTTGAGGRVMDQTDVWFHDAKGWKKQLGNHVTDVDFLSTRPRPAKWKDGTWLTARWSSTEYGNGGNHPPSFNVAGPTGTWAKVPNNAVLSAFASIQDIATLDDGTVFISGRSKDGDGRVRILSPDGKYVDMKETTDRFVTGTAARPVLLDGYRAWKNGAWVPTGLAAEASKRKKGIFTVRPGKGDSLWAVLSDGSVVEEKADGTVVDRSPKVKVSTTGATKHGGVDYATGYVLDGTLEGTPWIIGEDGSVHRYVGEAWQEVALPKPPFSVGASYKAARVMVRGDDVFVNAEYAEKGLGWRTPERYRALLRSKRPTETLRCNAPENSQLYASGKGFASWAPIADASCKTLFLFVHSQGSATPIGGDYPFLRGVLKGKKNVGEKLTFVEFETGGLKRLGMRVPNTEVANGIVEALTKQATFRPELVCGDPTPVRERVLVVSTGKFE